MWAFSLYFHKYPTRFRQNISFWRLDDKTFKCPALYLPETDFWSEYAMIGPVYMWSFSRKLFLVFFSVWMVEIRHLITKEGVVPRVQLSEEATLPTRTCALQPA